MNTVITLIWGLSLVALATLWRRRPHSVLDLWLMVVLCAWLFDVALAVVLNAGRFDLGFYAGRIYGLLAASFVLVVLLLENAVLYARLVETRDVIHSALDLVRPQAAARGISLSTAVVWQGHVLADRQRLQQVLLNLLSNAVKYNRPEGAVTVSCDAAPSDRCRLSVADS